MKRGFWDRMKRKEEIRVIRINKKSFWNKKKTVRFFCFSIRKSFGSFQVTFFMQMILRAVFSFLLSSKNWFHFELQCHLLVFSLLTTIFLVKLAKQERKKGRERKRQKNNRGIRLIEADFRLKWFDLLSDSDCLERVCSFPFFHATVKSSWTLEIETHLKYSNSYLFFSCSCGNNWN